MNLIKVELSKNLISELLGVESSKFSIGRIEVDDCGEIKMSVFVDDLVEVEGLYMTPVNDGLASVNLRRTYINSLEGKLGK